MAGDRRVVGIGDGELVRRDSDALRTRDALDERMSREDKKDRIRQA